MSDQRQDEATPVDSTATSPLPEAVADDVMAILEGVERQFDRLRSVQSAHADEVRSLAERAAELERREEQLERRRLELDEQKRTLEQAGRELDQGREAMAGHRAELDELTRQLQAEREQIDDRHEGERLELDAQRAQLETREAELRTRLEAIGDHEHALAQASARIAELETTLEQRRLELESTREHADAQRRQLESMQRDLETVRVEAQASEQAAFELLQETETHRDEMARRAESLTAELAERDATIARLDAELAGRDERIENLDGQLEDARRKLQIAGVKLAEFGELLGGQEPALERSAALGLELEEQRRLVESLTRRLADAGDDEALRRKDARIDELERALETLQAASEQRERRWAEREQQLESATAEHDREIERLHAAMDERASAADSPCEEGEAGRRANELAVSEQRLRQVQEQLRAERLAREQVIADAQRRQAELTAELARCRVAVETPAGGNAAGPLASVAHLDRRRQRLQRIRQRLRAQPRRPRRTSVDANALSDIRTQQLHLEEVRKLLVASEHQMVRKWSRNRSFLAAFAVMLTLILNGAAAWFAGERLFPPEPAATITLVAENGAGAKMDAVDERQWQRWHTALLHDEQVHAAVAGHLGDRLLGDLATTPAVRTMLVKELGVDPTQGGLALTLRRPDPEVARVALEVLATTMINESRRRAGEREDIPSVEAPGLASGGREAIAIMAAEDERLDAALPIFGGLCAVALAVFGIAYMQWRRTPCVLDEYTELFATSASTDPAEFDDFERSLRPLGG